MKYEKPPSKLLRCRALKASDRELAVSIFVYFCDKAVGVDSVDRQLIYQHGLSPVVRARLNQ